MIAVLLTAERGKSAEIVTQIPELEVTVGYVILPGACSPDVDSAFAIRGVREHQSVVLDQAVFIPGFGSEKTDAEFNQVFGFEDGKYVVCLVHHQVSITVYEVGVEGGLS